MRRLPIFLVLDVSESMVGSHLRAMQEGVSRLINQLRTDPHALDSVYLSVIAFAGVAKTLVPLVELMTFYPPRLPIGAGTSIGAALEHLMNEMDRQVVKNSMERKGDWKPVVYFLSDGCATDNPQAAIERWKKHYNNQATFISVGIGQFADLSALQGISKHSLRLEQTDERALKGLIDWITQSISTQSRSLGVEAPLSLEKNNGESFALSLVKDLEAASALDENYVIISALCSKTQLPYLLKYERMPDIADIPFFKNQSPDVYRYTGVFPVEADYADWSDKRSNVNSIAVSKLEGGGGCPHCGAMYGMATCGCGQVLCVEGEGEVVCPGCKQRITMGIGEGDFDIARSRG